MSPNKPDLYIGSFYRPPSAGDSPLIELEATLTNLPVDKTIILGGDFNCREIDWVRLTSNGPNHCHKLLDICNDFSLNQMNDKPTRLGSILELHLTNNPSLVRNCSIASGFSDHDGMIVHLVTLSHPTPGDSRGSSSPFRSISGISSHGADGGSARIPHECVQPSLSRSSSPSRSIHSPEHHVIFHPSCSHHVPKVA